MKTLIIGILFAAAAPAIAHESVVINQASELAPWCKSEAEAIYIGHGYMPFQWTAAYHDYSNTLYVDGRLRVHGDDVDVKCRITRGARVEFINVSIDDPKLAQKHSGS